MFALTLAAWILATPRLTPLPRTREAPYLSARSLVETATRRGPTLIEPGQRPDRDLLRELFEHLAVVKPHRPHPRAPPSLQLFVAVGTTTGGASVNAFGRF